MTELEKVQRELAELRENVATAALIIRGHRDTARARADEAKARSKSFGDMHDDRARFYGGHVSSSELALHALWVTTKEFGEDMPNEEGTG